MLPKAIFGSLLFAAIIFAPVATANKSDRYDMYNQCGAPFCGSTGGAAIAGAVASMDRNATAETQDDTAGERLPKM